METTTTTKKTLGRLKIKMQKIEKKSHLQVAFTKRRQGLFKKASELAILCGVEVGIIVQSPANKTYTFEEPKFGLESLINRINSNSPNTRRLDEGNSTAMISLEAEEEKLTMGRGFGWDAPIEGLDLLQLEEFLAALEFLRGRVERRI